MSGTLNQIFSSYAVTRGGSYADKHFEEWPVTLDEFVTGSKYLANPPLSGIQYDAVRHAERIYYPDMYDYLAKNACHGGEEETRFLRAYWAKPVRMVNFLELEVGQGQRQGPCVPYRCASGVLPVAMPAVPADVLRDAAAGLHSRAQRRGQLQAGHPGIL